MKSEPTKHRLLKLKSGKMELHLSLFASIQARFNPKRKMGLLFPTSMPLEQRTAQAINLLYFLPTAGVSLFAHRKNGYLDAAALRAAIPTGIVCALLAALAATALDSAVLRRPFGLFLLYAGLSILFEKPKTGSKKSP